MEYCVFCDINKLKRDILLESENFYIKVGVGILAPGHVMLIPKKHIVCFGQLPSELSRDFFLFKDKIFGIIKYRFSEPIIYEHGIYGQSINHAHLHFLPSISQHYNLTNIKEKLFKRLESTQIDNMLQIKEILQIEGSYFYLEQEGKKWAIHTKGLEEGEFTFRKEFAKLTGLHGLEKWQNIPKEEAERNKMWVGTTKKVFLR